MGLPKPDFDGLVKRLDPDRPSILLYHQPIEFEKGAAAGMGIQLSGHIHGPQLLPMVPLARLFFPVFRGLYHVEESYLVVSRGVGTRRASHAPRLAPGDHPHPVAFGKYEGLRTVQNRLSAEFLNLS